MLFAGYELWRRSNRTVLVALGTSIGVYRKGSLNVVIRRDQMTPYELRALHTVRYLLAPGIVGPYLVFFGLRSLAGSRGDMASLWLVASGVYVAALAASIVWTRIVCKHFHIPSGDGQEEVLFTSEDSTRLLG